MENDGFGGPTGALRGCRRVQNQGRFLVHPYACTTSLRDPPNPPHSHPQGPPWYQRFFRIWLRWKVIEGVEGQLVVGEESSRALCTKHSGETLNRSYLRPTVSDWQTNWLFGEISPNYVGIHYLLDKIGATKKYFWAFWNFWDNCHQYFLHFSKYRTTSRVSTKNLEISPAGEISKFLVETLEVLLTSGLGFRVWFRV